MRHGGRLSRSERYAALGAAGATLLFTGLSGAGKSTLASGVEEAFVRSGRPAFLLDGDNLRHGLNGDLGFSDRDRTENVRRAGEVARMFAESGALALIALICPFEEDRRLIRTMHEEAGLAYAEVFVDTSLEECERRDPKGLYARARSGQLPGFTGIDSAYEMPRIPIWWSGRTRAASPSRCHACSTSSRSFCASPLGQRLSDAATRTATRTQLRDDRQSFLNSSMSVDSSRNTHRRRHDTRHTTDEARRTRSRLERKTSRRAGRATPGRALSASRTTSWGVRRRRSCPESLAVGHRR